MTYFGFLLRFLVIPLGALTLVQLWRRRSPARREGMNGLWIAAGIQVALALVYTTPWDNYLVAQRVWYYDPARVSGLLLGYVPVEEYTFFVLEAILVALWWSVTHGATRADRTAAPRGLRLLATSLALALWITSTAVLVSGWQPARYLTLIVSWALVPVMIQLAFGVDILWAYRRRLAVVILPVSTYLCLADALAIRAGIWTISSAQSTGLFIGPLPIEEALFFFATVIILAFGMTLSLAPESRERFALLLRWRDWLTLRSAAASRD